MASTTRGRQIRKTVAVTVFRVTVLYLAYQHILVPRTAIISRELQKSLWWSVKNGWKMSRYHVRNLTNKKYR